MKYILKLLTISVICLQAWTIHAGEISAFADLLYWNISEDTSSTWATVLSDSSGALTIDPANVDFSWHIGFRGGAIYDSQKFWDAKFSWTFVRATTMDYASAPGQILTSEFFSGFISENVFFNANLNWKFVFNMFDLNFGHKFAVADNLTIRPYFGLKGGTINQKIIAGWNAGIYTAQEIVKHNFFGVGPSFGLDSNWHVYKNFSLFADGGLALLWGNWSTNDTYTRPAALLVTPTVITTNMSNMQLGTVMYQYILGLAWKYKGRSSLTVKIGYEMQYWANQLRLPTFQQLPTHGDLTLQGATCRISIDL